MAEHAQSRFFAFGETVCNAGEVANGLFVVKPAPCASSPRSTARRSAWGCARSAKSSPTSRCCANTGMNRRCVLRARPNCCSFRAASSNPSSRRIRPRSRSSRAMSRSTRRAGSWRSLFDLRGKLNKTELEECMRSVGVKRVGAGKEILKQDSREDRRLYVVRQGEVRIVRSEEATRASACDARPRRDLRREGLRDASGADVPRPSRAPIRACS